jgi:hypothetical protein
VELTVYGMKPRGECRGLWPSGPENEVGAAELR